MALFNNKKKTGNKLDEIPKLPELPKFPDMMEEPDFSREIPQLPRFPSSSLGQKFSQNTIKDAITGKKEEMAFADESAPEYGMPMMPKPARPMMMPMSEEGRLTHEIPYNYPPANNYPSAKMREVTEPVFIRIDKFEEGLNALEIARRQITEVEKTLKDIRKVKEEEEKELSSWEKEIQTAKDQIEKIDREIFSKLE
jgi:hypothetical protein